MKVLWLVSIVLPQAGKAFGFTGEHTGGWLTGMLNALKDSVDLSIVSVSSAVRQPCFRQHEGVTYYLVPDASEEIFSSLLNDIAPDLVHIWGSEYAAADVMSRVADPMRMLLSLQGIMGPCAEHLNDGVPAEYCTSTFFQRLIDRIIPGGLLDKQKHFFDLQAEKEANLLPRFRFITGRTEWDQKESKRLAPDAQYFYCGEILRPVFYQDHQSCAHEGTNLLITQGNYPLKGLHRLLQAMPKVVSSHPDVHLYIAGWPPLEKGPLLQPIISYMFPYQRYIKELIRTHSLEKIVHYTGPLNELQMLEQYLKTDIFVLPSSIENSPNSLGEAMMLSLPCVASNVGGMPSMLIDGIDGLLYPADNLNALADCLNRMIEDKEYARSCAEHARAHALKTHNIRENSLTMLSIYNTIINHE